MTLKEEVKTSLWKTKANRLKMMALLNIVDSRTMKSMLQRDDPSFLRIDVLAVISELTGLSTDGIINQ